MIMELLGLIAVVFAIWVLVSPFVVFGLSSRVNELATELAGLKDKLRKLSQTKADYPSGSPHGETSAMSSLRGTVPDSQRSDRAPPLELNTDPSPIGNHSTERQSDLDPAVEFIQKIVSQSPDISQQPGLTPKLESILAQTVSPPEIPSPATSDTLSSVDRAKPPRGQRIVKSAKIGGDEPSTLEELLGGKWLSWVGALAVIIGAGFGFKYAVENNWIGPRERVLIGIVTGLSCFAGGAYAIRRNYVFLAQGLTGAALGILYLSLYAAFGWYGILTYEAAFMGMILTTSLGLSFAGYFNVQPTAFLGMLGGFLTPAMLWPEHDPLWTLFPYLLMLDLGVLLIAGVRRWAGLEILAFCGTLIIWISWHHQFYHEALLPTSASFMTAFLVLFALLSVWHNVIRKRAALAGDFFLILVTPIAYFGALYSLTFERLPQWQGEFSLAMMLFYAVLAGLAGVWHPAGKSVIAALAGLAATFLILAAPLELTGHWVTICWIAQAVLLVELGLYFRERSLTWTGLGLLAKVQCILLIYFLGTLADPVHFQTAFVRIQLHLIGRPETPIDSAESFFALINGRSLSYLADVIGFAILAWELGRRRTDATLIESLLPPHKVCQIWLNVTVPVVALVMIILETYVWARIWNWDPATTASAWTIWTAFFACGLLLWSRIFLSRGIEVLGWLLFLLLACFVGFETLDALYVATLGNQMPQHRLDALWLFNPRGISFLTVVFAGGIVSLIYATFPPREVQSADPPRRVTSQQLTRLFGVVAFTVGLGLFLLETRVWGANHDWLASTTLSACAIGSTLFLIGAVLWRIARSAAWVDGIVQEAFVVICTLLLVNTLASIEAVRPDLTGASAETANWWLINPRGIGFLISIAGCASAAFYYWWRVEPSEKREPGWQLPQTMGVGAFLMGLIMVHLETWAWGYPHGWLLGTLFSSNAVWLSLFAMGLVTWSIRFRSEAFDGLIALMFLALLLTLVIIGGGTLSSLHERTSLPSRAFRDHLEFWIWNPRCAGFLAVIVATAVSGWLYRNLDRTIRFNQDDRSGSPSRFIHVSSLFGIAVYLTGVVMLTLEFYTQGTSRDWQTKTSLAITLVWTSYATLTLIAGICVRSGWLRVLSLSLFTLTIIKVFLFDVWHLDTVIRFFAFISLGIALLVVSFLYRRFRDRIRSWIAPV